MRDHSLFGKLADAASFHEDGGQAEGAWGQREIFREWVGLGLEEQYSDLELFLAALGDADRARAWMESFECRDLIPPGTPQAERELFASDLEVLFELWRARYGSHRQAMRD
jgi:hypothetical protein